MTEDKVEFLLLIRKGDDPEVYYWAGMADYFSATPMVSMQNSWGGQGASSVVGSYTQLTLNMVSSLDPSCVFLSPDSQASPPMKAMALDVLVGDDTTAMFLADRIIENYLSRQQGST